jgi:hypothetical protein
MLILLMLLLLLMLLRRKRRVVVIVVAETTRLLRERSMEVHIILWVVGLGTTKLEQKLILEFKFKARNSKVNQQHCNHRDIGDAMRERSIVISHT